MESEQCTIQRGISSRIVTLAFPVANFEVDSAAAFPIAMFTLAIEEQAVNITDEIILIVTGDNL